MIVQDRQICKRNKDPYKLACELEVEAGKNVVEERDKVVRIKFNACR